MPDREGVAARFMFQPPMSPLRLIAVLMLLSVTGCKLYMAGHTDDYGLITTGTGDFDPASGTMPFQMTYEDLGVTCSGNSSERQDGVTGLEGGYTCSDGRTGAGKSRLVGSDSGTGYFTDSCGNEFTYVWAVDPASIESAAATFRQRRPELEPASYDKCSSGGTDPEPVEQAYASAAAAGSVEEQRLLKLKRLWEMGLIDEDDYNAQKDVILQQMINQPASGAQGASAVASADEIPAIDFGTYYALVIGNNDYQYLSPLRTAVNDAREVAGILQGLYGYQVRLLLNATREQVIESLDLLTESLGRRDNLLIYFAGHGSLDEEANRGYWLPVDAKPNRRTNWLSNATITDTLKAIQAKHVLVVADSCFSGTLTREARVGLRSGDYWERMSKKRARVALVSGGLEPVSDGSGAHSPSAKALIDTLRQNTSIIDGTELFERLRRPVIINARQTPEYADVRNAGHDGGDFLFVRRR